MIDLLSVSIKYVYDSRVDIVFLRAWFPLQVPKFYTPVTNLLMPLEGKDKWEGLR